LSKNKGVNVRERSSPGKRTLLETLPRRIETTAILGCGLSKLSRSEKDKLAQFLEAELVGNPESPGTTDLTEHRIDVGGHASIKQRYYPVSPKI